jgi:hypothetical protein
MVLIYSAGSGLYQHKTSYIPYAENHTDEQPVGDPFIDQLIRHEVPSWLQEVELQGAPNFRLFEVRK